MSSIQCFTNEVFIQVFIVENVTPTNTNDKREIIMRGTKWHLMFKFKNWCVHTQITFVESNDDVQFPAPVFAEFSFSDNLCGHVEAVRYNGLFNKGETTDFLKLPGKFSNSSEPLKVQIRCELRLYPRNHLAVSIPHISITKRNLIESMAQFLFNKQFSDVSIVVQGQAIPAHKLMLSSASPVFSSLLDGNQENKIEVNDIDHETMKQAITSIYTGEAPNLEDCAEKILVAADRYQLDWLKTECEDVLAKKIDVENACNFFIIASLYNAEQLKKVAKVFVANNFTSVRKTEGFRKLGESHLLLLMEILQCYDSHEPVWKLFVAEDVNI